MFFVRTTQGEQKVTIDRASLENHSDKIRKIIQDARKKAKLLEKEVNQAYYERMTEAGYTAPTAVMTRVRDRRKPFSLTKLQANILASILQIEPASSIYPPESPQQNLLDDKDDDVIAALLNKHAMPQRKTQKDAPKDEIIPLKDLPINSPAPAASEVRNTPKIEIGFYTNPNTGGQRLFVNMDMSESQFERLTLAIPAYMMKTTRVDEKIHVQAKVDIFPYQAEMIMRAIFGEMK